MAVKVERQVPQDQPIEQVKLTSEGGSGNHIVATPRDTGQITFNYIGTGSSKDNLNVSRATAIAFANHLLELAGA